MAVATRMTKSKSKSRLGRAVKGLRPSLTTPACEEILLPHEPAVATATPISERERELLDTLSAFQEWARPMDLGGRDGSHHSAALRQLAQRGLVERNKLHAIYCLHGSSYRQKLVNNRWVTTEGHPPSRKCCCKGSCRYKITAAGRKAVAP